MIVFAILAGWCVAAAVGAVALGRAIARRGD